MVGLRGLGACACLLLASVFSATIASAAEPDDDRIPIQAWVHDPLIDSVAVSPNGKRLVALTLSDVNKAPEITLWSLDDMSAPPKRFAPKDSKALSVFWLNDNNLFVVGRQKFDIRVGGRPTRWFRSKVYIYHDIKPGTKKFRPTELFSSWGQDFVGSDLENLLRHDPNKVLISLTTPEFATDFYELNLTNFRTKRVYRGSPKKSVETNFRGEVYARQELVSGGSKGTHINFSYQNPKTGDWDVHHSLYAREREGLQPVGQDLDGRTLYMLDNTGRDKSVIRKYDVVTRQVSEPLFGGPDVEAINIMQGQHPAAYGQLLGYTYTDDRIRREIIHPEIKELYDLIDSALPNRYNNMTSMSDDLSRIVVSSSGDREPGAYYLLSDRKNWTFLGRSHPNLDPDKLSEMAYVEYKARDELTIPAYLTLPRSGEAPYPAVILPHGGPWARDYWGWDLWVQFLTNRGYAVLQPNYRGSDGWGQKLWRAGDREWGQKMQDDKDDGAAWLVQQGIAAKDRIAIFGYSYGGYAAMAAVVRPNSPYQCAISGAGLAELRSFNKVTFENVFIREYQNPTIGGLSPIDHIKQANIPIHIFHGDRDQRVPVIQSRKYYRALKNAGATVEYTEVPDLWHSLPWFPTHRVAVLEILEDYFGNRCGPNGL